MALPRALPPDAALREKPIVFVGGCAYASVTSTTANTAAVIRADAAIAFLSVTWPAGVMLRRETSAVARVAAYDPCADGSSSKAQGGDELEKLSRPIIDNIGQFVGTSLGPVRVRVAKISRPAGDLPRGPWRKVAALIYS